MQRQSDLLNERYDLSDRAMQNVMMSGGRKPVQQGVRVKLAAGVTWDALAAMSPDEIRQKGLLPPGFLPLPRHAAPNPENGPTAPQSVAGQLHHQPTPDLVENAERSARLAAAAALERPPHFQ